MEGKDELFVFWEVLYPLIAIQISVSQLGTNTDGEK